MTPKRLVAALIAGGVLFGIAAAVQASIPDSNGVAHGCYLTKTKLGTAEPRPGDLRLIDTDKGQTCAADEQPVDLATTSYQGQTAYTLTFSTSLAGPGYYLYIFDCASGFVALHPWVKTATSGFDINNVDLVHLGAGNDGLATTSSLTGPPNNQDEIYWQATSVVNNYPFTIHGGTECIDGRVFGQPGPASPTAPSGGAAGSARIVQLKP